MENTELHKIEEKINKMDFALGSISHLLHEIDSIYIILDEERHINIYNERLCSIKSHLAKGIEESDANKKEEIFIDSKKEILQLLEEISEVV